MRDIDWRWNDACSRVITGSRVYRQVRMQPKCHDGQSSALPITTANASRQANPVGQGPPGLPATQVRQRMADTGDGEHVEQQARHAVGRLQRYGKSAKHEEQRDIFQVVGPGTGSTPHLRQILYKRSATNERRILDIGEGSIPDAEVALVAGDRQHLQKQHQHAQAVQLQEAAHTRCPIGRSRQNPSTTM